MDLTVLRMEAEQLLMFHLDPLSADQEIAEPQAVPWH